MAPEPIYTPDNCRVSFRLTWSLAVFWRSSMPEPEWLDELTAATEKDGVRILNHQPSDGDVSQFLLSTTPNVSPSAAIRSVKGRLQALVRPRRPRALSRNYFIHSIGTAKREVVEAYVADQLGHHRMAHPQAQRLLGRHQISRQEIDLGQVRHSAHGRFVYNLHLVLVNDGRWREIREERLARTNRALVAAGAKKGHLLSRVGVFADHLHLTLGCDVSESPEEVALGYMNNLAYAHGMRRVYQFGYYVGTFGQYDLGAVR